MGEAVGLRLGGAAYGVLAPADLSAPTRRRFLQGGGFLMGFAVLGSSKAWAAGEEPSLKAIGPKDDQITGAAFRGFAPGGLIRIGRDGVTHLIIPGTEMGQGVYTGQAMLIAEELEVGLDQIGIIPAPPNEKLYASPLLKSQATGGSTSIRGAWMPMRQAGAAARTMLIQAAAQRWSVAPEDCFAERAVVHCRTNGQSLGYGALVDAASRIPVPQNVPLKTPDQYKLLGRPLQRIETPTKVNGSAIFGIDIKVPDMKIAAVEICPLISGRLGRVNDSAARAIPGVIDVLRIEDAVAVIAGDWWTARKGVEALEIEWVPGPLSKVSSESIWNDLRYASEHGKPILARGEGEVDGAMQNAPSRIEAVYELPFLAHATMEPMNSTVHVRGGECEIWLGTQAPTAVQTAAAQTLGIPPEKVIIHNQLIGGGFGRRLVADYVVHAVKFARQVPYPIKLLWTREQDIRHDRFRPAYYDRIAAGLGADGLPAAWTHRVTGGSVLGSYLPTGFPQGVLDPDAVEGAAKPPYALPAIRADWVRKDPPMQVNWWRGVGPTHNVFVVESFLDECAHAAGRDPVEYRRALLRHNPRARHVVELVAEKAGWGSPLPPRVGRGISFHDSFGSYVGLVCEAEVTPAGEVKLRRLTAAVDCGQTINPNSVAAQIEGGTIFGLSAALYNGITLSNGTVDQTNFHDYRQMRINEVPPFATHIVQNREDPGGIGETGTVSAAPALANAIFAATGVRLRRIPFQPELLALDETRKQTIAGFGPELIAGAAAVAAGLAGSEER